jgi:hypothetical protein
MEKTQAYPIKAVVILLMVGILTAQCASSATVRTGVFPDTSRITADLKRGSSSKLDVKQILGVPKGTGGALLPTDHRPKEVWLYDDLEVTGAVQRHGTIQIDMRQQILLIFFEKEVYDGYLWYTNSGKGEAW